MPEVVQTSNMDCGPAALKCLLEGYGIRASYGRLREACQTGLDGTSIDTMEAVARQLGLEAEQVMLPPDSLTIPEAKALPALVVVNLPNGLTHFVVIWRRHGRLLQVMDPSVGRRWVPITQFLREIYLHSMAVPAGDWREFAGSEEFQSILGARFKGLGIRAKERAELTGKALADASWKALGALDAAVRLTQSLLDAGTLETGVKAARLLTNLCAKPEAIPERYWCVSATGRDGEGCEHLQTRGAVLVKVTGRGQEAGQDPLSRELEAAITEKPARPGRELWNALRASGRLAGILLATALLVSAAGVVTEALLFRSLFDITHELGLMGQRLGAMSAILLFSGALLMIEFPAFAVGARLGRQLENRLRMRFLEKIPKLEDRYFQSRLTSDMAERSHAAKRLRSLPDQVRQLLRAVFELTLTAAAISWLEPRAAGFVWLIVGFALLPALISQPLLAERDLRVRSHAAGLTRFYLDAMLGLLPIRTHGGERAVMREHGKLLRQWAEAGLGLQRLVAGAEAVQFLAMFGTLATLLLSHPFRGSDVGRLLLLTYWALNLPVLGQEASALLRQYPYYRTLTLRLLDPLGAPEAAMDEAASDATALSDAPVIEFRGVSAEAAGHPILSEICCRFEAARHVAMVGPSGAGKSSLVGLLLGWLTPAAGEILVDGLPLRVERMRAAAAWVDPSVQIWNRSLLANVAYGATPGASAGDAMDAALLRGVLENLPEGMQTRLGEGGSLVSGGEGQRVRLARGLLKTDAKLVLLDEPFRGLDRETRRQLLRRARKMWRGATLVCVTHDIGETLEFDQVGVLEGGRLVEFGAPEELAKKADSRYAELLAAEEAALHELWGSRMWRHVQVQAGRLVEETSVVEEMMPRAEVA